MSGMLRKCCPPVCCTGDEWTCDEDLVEFDITVHHEIKLNRTTDMHVEACCPDLAGCHPRNGVSAVHDDPLDLTIEYDCRFKVYMTPPSGTYTNLYNLGKWVQSDACAPSWVQSPKVRGTWTSETTTVDKFPCGEGNCYSSFAYSRQNRLLVDAEFYYDEPAGTIPPSGILSVIKLRNLPENHGQSGGCCTGIKTPGCDDRCLIDLQVALPMINVSMSNGGAGYAFRELVNRLAGTSPACTVGALDINQTYPAPNTTFEFYPSVRKVYEGNSVITCDPVLGASQAVAAVDSALPDTWQSLKAQMQASLPVFQDFKTDLHWALAGVANGLYMAGTNGSSANIVDDTAFYGIGSGSAPGTVGPYRPDVVCIPADTEHKQCDPIAGLTSNFYVPPVNQGGICPKYKFNLSNGWKDHIFEFQYEATWGYVGASCLPCTQGLSSAFPGMTDKTGVKLKSIVTVNSITPEPSTGC
jgi:hypothetical protein